MNKVLFYIDSMQKGGANRVMANLVDYFTNKDFDVILVNDIGPNDDYPEYEVNSLAKRIILNESGANAIISNLKRIKKLRKVILEEKPDCVLSFMGPPNVRMLLASVFLPCRKVASVRNDPNREYGNNIIKKFLTNCLFLLANGCVFQTEDASKYFFNRIRSKSTIIVNPVNELFFNTPSSEIRKNIVTVGRLFPQKNHKLLIHAFSLISSQYPDDRLIIYGEGPLKSELKEYARKLGIEERVVFSGAISNVNEELSKAKVFVLSSDYEGLPNALMEAMACGTAVVSTDCPSGGPKYLLKESNAGILVSCNNADEMAEAISVMMNEEKNELYRERAKKKSIDFLPETVFDKWKKFLFEKK